jgi:hypothetical protein
VWTTLHDYEVDEAVGEGYGEAVAKPDRVDKHLVPATRIAVPHGSGNQCRRDQGERRFAAAEP